MSRACCGECRPYSNAIPRQSTRPDRARRDTLRSPLAQAQRLASSGRLGAAIRALEDKTTVARLTPEVLQSLRDKHPQREGEWNFDPVDRVGPIPDSPNADEIRRALHSFTSDTAPGLSRWTVSLLKLVSKSEAVMNLLLQLQRRCRTGVRLDESTSAAHVSPR